MTDSHLHTNCLLCGSADLNFLKKFEKDLLCKCKECGFVFSRKIPAQEELINYYTENYDRTRYFSPITKKRYEELLDSFESYRKTNKILDIGCGYGFLLEIAKEKGWEVYGTELSDEVAGHCEKKGINMCVGELDKCDFEDESFDIVFGIEVLEHLNKPNDYIKKAYKVLRKGGIFYLSTPNFNSYLRYRLQDKYDVIDYPNHLAYYTKKTLQKLFTQNGFKKLRIETSGMSLTRLRTSKGVSNQEYVSETSDDEMLRFKIEKNAGLRLTKNVANTILNATKTGISLKGTFIKP